MQRQAGFRGGSSRANLLAAAAGALVAFAVVIIGLHSGRADRSEPSHAIMDLVSSSNGRLALAFSAIAMAGPVEEVLFRGFVLGGLAARYGTAVGGCVSCLLFWAAHLPQTVHSPYAMASVGALACAVTLIRIRTGSVVPGMLTHACYNTMIMMPVLALEVSSH